MKLKDDFNLDLLVSQYGFEEQDEETKESHMKNDDYYLGDVDYVLYLGDSRRGQQYYVLVDKQTKEVDLYATKPDGSPGTITFPQILVRMAQDNIFEQ